MRKEYGKKESRIQLMLALRPRGPRDLFAQLPTQLFFRDFREIFLVCSALFCNILCLYGTKTQKTCFSWKKFCSKSAKMAKNRCFSKNASKRVFFQKNLCFKHSLKSGRKSRCPKTGFWEPKIAFSLIFSKREIPEIWSKMTWSRELVLFLPATPSSDPAKQLFSNSNSWVLDEKQLF